MGKKNKRSYIRGGAVGLIMVFVLCILFHIKAAENEKKYLSEQPLSEDDVIAVIDGYPIGRKEFSLFIRDQRSDTAQYFYHAYGAEMKSGFWTTEFDGQTPSDYCKQKAMEEIVRYKVERILAYERGLIVSVGYRDLMADMKSLNEENSKNIAAGGVTYGLTAYEPWQYLLYIRSDCNTKLIKDEAERYINRTPEEIIRMHYEENKENYSKGYRVVYERLEADSAVTETGLETALGLVAERASMNEESLKEAAAALEVLENYSVKEEISSEITVSKDDIWEQFVQKEVMLLEPGMVSAPLLLSGNKGCLLRGIERTALGYNSFEDVKNGIIYESAQEAVQVTLENRIKEASVVLDSDKYEQIIVE